MTRKEAIRQTHQADVLQGLGFTSVEAEALRRISMTLRRWYEHECNGTIQRDETTGIAYAHYGSATDRPMLTARIPDRENGAIRRLKGIIEARNSRAGAKEYLRPAPLSYYLQTDPRGASLYILRPGDVPEGGDVGSYYSRGICVY